jgi:hypothetical protein
MQVGIKAAVRSHHQADVSGTTMQLPGAGHAAIGFYVAASGPRTNSTFDAANLDGS